MSTSSKRREMNLQPWQIFYMEVKRTLPISEFKKNGVKRALLIQEHKKIEVRQLLCLP